MARRLAAVQTKINSYIMVDCGLSLCRWMSVTCRQYSMYGPDFVDPVYRKQKQEEMYKTGDIEHLLHVPVKAAKVNQTCSVFYDEDVRKLINYVMRKGKKSLARNLVEKAFEHVKRIQLQKYHSTSDTEKKASIETDPLKVFHKAVTNSRPLLQLTAIKRGGIKYQVPVPITDNRSRFLAMNWLIEAAKEKERTVHFPEKLAWELMDAAANHGKVIKRKQDLHRQCEANRAYAHYRWS